MAKQRTPRQSTRFPMTLIPRLQRTNGDANALQAIKLRCNDETGAPAYDPAVMLKIVLLAYSRGVISSRAIERLCRENVVFMAISGDSAPQFTTIAKFVRTLAEDVADVFARV